eukprot:NODE_9527_length_1417_cov_6.753488.p1 GENE.NODE_9527_length_1417_cov_6.753488~~NODE_9527_length_1417_cov_6.753488.p1  ORF type:complete len:317 (+),score=89.72 NODE_9527_length_1417_cov_6.753488:117-1067(+)
MMEVGNMPSVLRAIIARSADGAIMARSTDDGRPRSTGSDVERDPPTAEASAKLAAGMPLLAGAPLMAPRFHQTGWRPRQVFTEADDPDRASEPWALPTFLQRKDPMAQRANVSVEDLPLERSTPDRFARVVRGAMNAEDCAELLARVNDKGFTPVLLNVGRGEQRLDPAVRDGHRVIVDCPQLTTWLLEVIRPFLPDELPNGSRLFGLNERCRFLCYTPGQFFDEHFDGQYRRPAGHPREGDRSFITVQFYLHDVPKENGGATTFFPSRACAVAHQPEAGSVLLFTQNLEHEGSLVRAGLKYTLRTEVMYSPPPKR